MTDGPRLTWSASRQRIFNECRRRYYYNYYLSRLDPEIARLSRLSALPLWAGNVAHDAIEAYLRAEKAGARPTLDETMTALKLRMSAQFRESESGEGSFRLQEHEYSVPIPRLNKMLAAGTAVAAVLEFIRSPILQEMLRCPDWLSVESREEFTVKTPAGREATAVVKMDAAYRTEDGSVRIVDWKTGRHIDPANVTQIGAYALYAFRAGWAHEPGLIKTTLAYLTLGEYKDAWVDWALLSEATDMIGNSYDEMVNSSSDNIEDFPRTDRDWPCRTCPFRRPCKGVG